MKELFYIISLVFLFSSTFCFDLSTKNKLFQMINDQVNAKREAPTDYEKYIANLNTVTNYYFGKYSSESEISTLQTSYGFGSTTLNLFKTALSNKNPSKIELITEANIKAKNSVTEFIGTLIYDNDGKVYYVLFIASTTGDVLKQFDKIIEQKCETKKPTFLHKKHCWDESREVERENNQAEIDGMKQVILSKSLLGIRTKFYEENEKLLKEIVTAQEQQKQSGSGGDSSIPKDPVQEAIQARKTTFITNLKKLVDSSRKKPADYDKLVRNIHSFTEVNMDMFNKNEVDAICQKYSLPDDVKTKLKNIAFVSQETATENIKYINDNKKATIEEILGFVMKEKDTIFFAFIRSITEGEIPYRTKNVTVKKCHRDGIGINSCHDEKEIVEDPYTAEELQTVKSALLALSSESLNNKLDTISESQILLATWKIVSPDGQFAAILNKDGKIYVGPAANPLSGTLYTLGTQQAETYAPYSLQVKDNGNLYIINKNNDKVWTSNTANQGEPPFKLTLTNNGELNLTDKNGKLIYQGKK